MAKATEVLPSSGNDKRAAPELDPADAMTNSAAVKKNLDPTPDEAMANPDPLKKTATPATIRMAAETAASTATATDLAKEVDSLSLSDTHAWPETWRDNPE